jgi:two-component system cell cycle sensor histidine kinase/response regulator CckA
MSNANTSVRGRTHARWAFSDLPWSVQQIHDLRNVLALAAGYAGSVVPSASSNKCDAESLAELRQALESAMRIARELILAGKSHDIERQELDLGSVLRNMRSALRGAVSDGIRVEIDAPSSPYVVFASQAELDRIVFNLVLNAADAMPEGGRLTIGVEMILNEGDARVDEAPTRDPFVRLTVADTGGGIPCHLRSSVFEPYFTTKPQGTGIGLASVASTVAGLGGWILISDGDGTGTRVHVDFPLATPRTTDRSTT